MKPTAIAASLARVGLPVPLYMETPKEEGTRKRLRSGEQSTTLMSRTFPSFLDEIREAQDQMEFPPSFSPHADHGPSQEFLQEHGISDFWRREPSLVAALKCLTIPHLCRMLQMMLLGPLNYLSISRRLAAKFGLLPSEMNPQVVRTFSHYFWNYDVLNKSEWEYVLKNWMPGDVWDMHLALRAPRTSVGTGMVLSLLDQGGDETLKEVLIYRFGRDTNFMELVKATVGMSTGVAKAQTMLMHTQAMIQLQEQLDSRRGGSAELLEELRRIEAVYDPRKLTSVRELPLQLLPETIDVEGEEVL